MGLHQGSKLEAENGDVSKAMKIQELLIMKIKYINYFKKRYSKLSQRKKKTLKNN